MHPFKSLIAQHLAPQRDHFPVLAGNSIAALATRQMVQLAASVYDPLVITGPEASGKAAIAHAVHMLSPLSDQSFLSFDCTDISPKDQSTIFATGHLWPHDMFSGTILLDEIGSLTVKLQKGLLEWLDWNLVQQRPLRLIAMTSHALDGLVARGQFDATLYSRLQKLVIPSQPLARRRKDIPALMLAIWANSHDSLPPSLNRAAWHLLEDYGWPGNFIELQRMAEIMARTHGGRKIGTEQVRRLLAVAAMRTLASRDPQSAKRGASSLDLKSHLAREEAMLLLTALERCGGAVTDAAQLTGLDGSTFRKKMRQYGIVEPIADA
jgi:DNA-binding NtrC family response regulator